MIQLQHGDWTLAVRPEIGAAITQLTWRAHDILRPAPDGAGGPLETGSFPLIPYANRIDRGAFTFAGREVALPPTSGYEPHAGHGTGWLQPWAVLQRSADCVVLALAAAASPEWPWAWTASHRLRLDANGLEMTLSITNEDREPMPAGLGLHPYFNIAPETTLTTRADVVWLNGEDDIPECRAPASAVVDWSRGPALGRAPFVDNAYCDWAGSVRLDHGEYILKLTASRNARWLQIYAPRGENYVCIEPMTHRPNAVNAAAGEDAGVVTLQPAETLSLSLRISVDDKPPTVSPPRS